MPRFVTTQFHYFSPLLDTVVTCPSLSVASAFYRKYGKDYERFIGACYYVQAHRNMDFADFTVRTIYTETDHTCAVDFLYKNKVFFHFDKIDESDRITLTELMSCSFFRESIVDPTFNLFT